jgi:hypothetical protein
MMAHRVAARRRHELCSAPPAGTAGAGRRTTDDEEGVALMAAMKPRTGDGPLEVTKEGRSIILRMPLEGGGRLVVEMTPDEVQALAGALSAAVS